MSPRPFCALVAALLLPVLAAVAGCPGGGIVGEGAGVGGGCSAVPACPPGAYPVCEQGAVEAECCDEGAVVLRCATSAGFMTHDCPECDGGSDAPNGLVCARPVDGGAPACCEWDAPLPNPCFPDGG